MTFIERYRNNDISFHLYNLCFLIRRRTTINRSAPDHSSCTRTQTQTLIHTNAHNHICLMGKFCPCALKKKFPWLHNIVGSVGRRLWELKHDAIHSSRNFKTTCYNDWKSLRMLRCKYFRVFGCQLKNSANWEHVRRMIKINHPVRIMAFEVITIDGNIMRLFICPHGLWLNTDLYSNHLEYIR